MSGFLPDLANWALRGGAGRNNNNNEEQQQQQQQDDDDNNNNNTNTNEPQQQQQQQQPLSREEMRAQRLARIQELQQQQQQQQNNSAAVATAATATAAAATADMDTSMECNEPEPMDVEEEEEEETTLVVGGAGVPPNHSTRSTTPTTTPAVPAAAAVSASTTTSADWKATPPPAQAKTEPDESMMTEEDEQDEEQDKHDTTTTTNTTMTHKVPTKKKKRAEVTTTTVSTSTTTNTTTTRTTSAASDNTSQNKKLQRKKEMLLQKILAITLKTKGGSVQQKPTTAARDASSSSSSSLVTIDLGSNGNGNGETPDISVQSIAEILATRLSMEPGSADTTTTSTSTTTSTTTTSPPQQQKSLIAYLGQCHRLASEEIKTLLQQQQQQQQQATSKSKGKSSSSTAAAATTAASAAAMNDELLEILREIQRQVVSYAASCLMEPDLFEMAKDAPIQLGQCLLTTVTADPASSITFGVHGGGAGGGGFTTSFYYLLCEELYQQDESAFESVIGQAANYIFDSMKSSSSVLDGNADGTNATTVVAAWTALCGHKRAADTLTRLPNFLLPPAGSMEATQQIRPALPSAGRAGASSGVNNLLQMLAAASSSDSNQYRPYLRRSGLALEKDTILGRALRVGVPRTNAAFSPSSVLRQSMDSIHRINRQQRQQLAVHQEACNQFIMALIKAGAPARERVMQWFADALMVNVGASAMQPDPSKVSSGNLLLNVSVALLKLCEPFVNDPKKQHLIDPGFVSSPVDHKGVFSVTGVDAVDRLGETDNAAAQSTAPYNPKNKFIPLCFFFCARSLHLGIAPLLSYHENLLRHISHAHYEITTNNRDLQSDPHFSFMVSRQRSIEVSLYQEEMVTDTLRFCNLIANVLHTMEDDALRTMPEDFVSDVCHIIMSIAKLKGNMLRGIEFRDVFHMVVKLLSAKYASMVRNYNLRARLGDVLYELYLPPIPGDRRDIPSSICTDPLAGGQTFLLSDPAAQETLAPSLLLLYGEVEHTGYYDKMSHRAKIASLLKYLWESSEHRPAFRRITQNKESFIKFANGIMNETNTLIATVMQKLPEIRNAQEQMKNVQEWAQLSEEQQNQTSSRLEDNEREVKYALPLCNKTIQMFGYLNTDPEIRSLFLLEELCPRLVGMLLHVLTKLVGSRGLELKVDNPEQYEFRPKEMLRDLCAIFSLFAMSEVFQLECARAGCQPSLLQSALKTCRRLNLLTGESMTAFEALPALVEAALKRVNQDEALMADAPDEFLDEILSTFMKDPVILPSGHYVDRSTITQHLLNDPIDPFSREPMSVDDIQPATQLKAKMDAWLEEKRCA